MKTAETINLVCLELGTTKAELAKKMGMLPSSLYRKLSRESMTFEEFQKCLDLLGVTIEFNLRYPDGSVQSSQANHERLLERMDLLEAELDAAKKAAEFHKKTLRDLRTELNSAGGYAELGRRPGASAEEYLEKIQQVLGGMEHAISDALGEAVYQEPEDEAVDPVEIPPGRRVLIADDNELNRHILTEILVQHGLIVEEAENGSKAAAAIQEKEPGYYHYVLMDIEMPVMDGYESTLRIRKLPNRMRANVPIIALTANASEENRERAVEVGMDDFLAKPVNSARLLKSMAKFL